VRAICSSFSPSKSYFRSPRGQIGNRIKTKHVPEL
jgi:hypothetical protein